jgi:membrane glycosyltransferase
MSRAFAHPTEIFDAVRVIPFCHTLWGKKGHQAFMVEQSLRDDRLIAAPSALLAMRRALFFLLVALTIAAEIALCAFALSVNGLRLIDLVLVALFAITLPWYVIGFWNAVIALFIMRFARDPVASVTPAAALVDGSEPIKASTAILMCIRNEPPDRTIRNITPLVEHLVARGVGERFHLYLLSDTTDPAVARPEAARFREFTNAWLGRIEITYRRRRGNIGFKAGNIRDFCDRWGAIHDFAIVLDADSVMTADVVLRIVRIMQADSRIGILQTLVTGLPSTSAFARLFQFGMRLAMRSYTIGSAWWQADCGPYWGHNAIIRLAPFMAHCRLPLLPQTALINGHVLSHDQIEAVLMRRAGYEVRVLAEEGDSFEQNPPTLIEFMRRDIRWCQGNMQYWHFLRIPGLKPVSRYQLLLAILLFLGSPAWIALLMLGTAAVAWSGSGAVFIRPDAGLILLVSVLVTWFAPNIATAIDVLAQAKLRYAFGGSARFLGSFAAATIFSLLLVPIMWFGHTLFLGGLLFGRTVGWTVQARDDHAVPFALAARQFWPQTLIGLLVVGVLAVTVPGAIPYALIIAGGPLLSILLAVLSASPSVGRALLRIGLGRLPEETMPPPSLTRFAAPAPDNPGRRSP